MPETMLFDRGKKVVSDEFEELPDAEFPVSDETFFASETDFEGNMESELWEEEKVELIEKAKNEPIAREEIVLSCNEEPAEDGISLRQAIIAQAVLERKCR